MAGLDNVAIVVRIGSSLLTQGQCRLKGYETGWFLADDVDFGISCEANSVDAEAQEGDFYSTTFTNLKIKKRIDPCTPQSLQGCCAGNGFSSAEIHNMQTFYNVETGQNSGAVSPILILRFEVVQIASWSLDGNLAGLPTETVSLTYEKVATAWVNQKDGSLNSYGWAKDFGSNSAWGEPWVYAFKARGRAN
jgi:type VI protein secretion system component Hcp